MTGNNGSRIVVQDRDRKLLSELAVMRIVDREQAKPVAGFGSTTRANARLLALTRAGLLRRFFWGTAGAGQKALYALSQKGADLVQVPYRGPRRKTDEMLVADFFVTHQLRINEIYLIAKYGGGIPGMRFARWIAFHEAIEQGLALIPDGYFEIVSPARTLAAFLEVDLGHESHRVWRAKVEAYLRYAISGKFPERFRQAQFRTLVVTDSERRMGSLRTATAAITEKIFWFSTFENIQRNGFWSPIWKRPKDDRRVPLIEVTP